MTVTYQVFLQEHPNQGYTATVLGWSDCTVEGKTKEEALIKARAAIAEQLSAGEIVCVDVKLPGKKNTENPWVKNFGRFKNDATFDDMLAEIESYRREIDEEKQT